MIENKLQFAYISFSPGLYQSNTEVKWLETLCVTWNLFLYVQLRQHSFPGVHSVWIHDEQVFVD